MSEAKISRTEKAAALAPARQRQTITLNESTNEAKPRKGIKRRSDIGDKIPPTPPLPKGGDTEIEKE